MEMADTPCRELTIRRLDDLAQARPHWLALERAGAAATICQRWEWVDAWYREVASAAGREAPEPVLILVRRGDDAVALLPFSLRRRKGFRVLEWIGDEHFNYPGPLFAPALLVTIAREGFDDLWARIVEWLPPYDVLRLSRQLPTPDGCQSSPFQGFRHFLGPNSSHRLVFEHHDWPRLLAELRGRKTRKRMRNEESRLVRSGEVRFETIDQPDALEAAIDELFRQRIERFRALGIPLEERIDDYRRFYLDLLRRSLTGRSADRYYLTRLTLDGEMLAGLLVAEKDDIAYPLINSMTTAPIARLSPGDYLLRHLIQDACERRLRAIDFGLAEDSSYKTAWCNRRSDTWEIVAGGTPFGHVAVGLLLARTALARKIKQSPRAWAWYRFFRSLKNDG